MSLYLDGSVLVKTLTSEPESARVLEILEKEPDIVVSSLAKLEALIVVESWVAGGIPKRQGVRRREALEKLLGLPSFRFAPCRATIFEVAEAQLGGSYCATLDRLHLAAMADLNLHRLFTNDARQATAARALGFEVIMP